MKNMKNKFMLFVLVLAAFGSQVEAVNFDALRIKTEKVLMPVVNILGWIAGYQISRALIDDSDVKSVNLPLQFVEEVGRPESFDEFLEQREKEEECVRLHNFTDLLEE